MFVRGKVPAVCAEEPVSSTRCSLWNCSTVEMSDGGFVLCPFPFFKNPTIQHWLFSYGTLLLLWNSLLLYLLCNSFSRKTLVEEESSLGSLPATSLCGRGEGVPALSVPLLSPWLPLPIFLQSPWFVNCLHLFCQPTCTKCKKEFLNR